MTVLISAAGIARLPIKGCLSRRSLLGGATATIALAFSSSIASAEEPNEHIVQPGETLYRIAQSIGSTVSALAQANDLENPNMLSVGQRLILPTSSPTTPAPAATPTVSAPAEAPRLTASARGGESPAAPARDTARPGAVEIARSLIGTPYAWGGASPSWGFDCSGFTSYVYSRIGQSLPRDVWGQYGATRPVSPDQRQPGDLVFFANTYTAGLSHVGIYSGNGRFIHSQDENTGVVESSLGESYWASRYAGARRP